MFLLCIITLVYFLQLGDKHQKVSETLSLIFWVHYTQSILFSLVREQKIHHHLYLRSVSVEANILDYFFSIIWISNYYPQMLFTHFKSGAQAE